MTTSRIGRVIYGLMVLTLLTFLYSMIFTFDVKDVLINQNLIRVPLYLDGIDTMSMLGKHEMSTSTVSILGVGRNIAHRLPAFLEHIQLLGAQFSFHQIVFVEGDSSDDTADVLSKWMSLDSAARKVFSINTTGILEDCENPHFHGKALPREGRITVARNKGLEELKKLPKTDFVIMVDMDVQGWDMVGIRDSFGRSDSWEAICAHGILLHGIYRDTYALRVLDINTNHHICGDDHKAYNISRTKYHKIRAKYKRDKGRAETYMSISTVRAMQRKSPGEGLKPFHVDSCFGGMAIYKYDVIMGCEYQHRHPDPPNMLDCEHVLFNKCLREKKGARVLSNPNMKLWYGHTGLTELDWSKVVYNMFNTK